MAEPYNEPFFWHRIVNVGWGGAVVIVQVTAPEIKFYDVAVLSPEDWFDDNFGGSTIGPVDYQEQFVLNLGSGFGVGTVVVEDELTDVWLWDGYLVMDPDDPDVAADLAAGNATFGYGFTLHLPGQQVAWDTAHTGGGAPRQGDYVTHTHPNGLTTVYSNGYTGLGSGYVGWHGPSEDFTGVAIRPSDPNGFPEPPADFSGTDAWYWRRIVTRPESTAAILRRSFLVNFKTNFTQLAELEDFTMSLNSPLEWSIRGFPQGTSFTIADGVVTPAGGVAPKFSASGSVAGSHSGTIRRFNSSGFVS